MYLLYSQIPTLRHLNSQHFLIDTLHLSHLNSSKLDHQCRTNTLTRLLLIKHNILLLPLPQSQGIQVLFPSSFIDLISIPIHSYKSLSRLANSRYEICLCTSHRLAAPCLPPSGHQHLVKTPGFCTYEELEIPRI